MTLGWRMPDPALGAVAPVRPGVATALVTPALNPIVRWAFALLVFSIPFEFPERSFPVEIPTITAAIFLLATPLQLRACYARRPAALFWFALYLYAFAVSAAWNARHAAATDVNNASYGTEVTKLFALLLQVVLVFWAAYNLLQSPRVARFTLVVLALACTVRALLPVLGIARTSHAIWGGGERVTALGQNANNSAMILAAGFVALLGLQYRAERPLVRPRWLVAPIIALLGLSVVDTGSRGGIVALGAGLLPLMFSGARTLWLGVRNAVIAALAIGLVIFTAYQSDSVRRRFTEAVEGGALAGRERIYPSLLQMSRERPFIGWGPVNNKYELGLRLNERIFRRRDAHNVVLEVLSSTGLAGTIPFLAGLGLCCVGAWRARRGRQGMLPFALLLVVLAANMSGNWIASKLLWLVLAYGLASMSYGGGDASGLPPPAAVPTGRPTRAPTAERAVREGWRSR